ncbi:MAG: pilus assembly protein PilM [Candidatus Gracilibacteria bacterium]
MSFIPKKIIGLDFHDYFAQVVEIKASGKKVSLKSFNRVAIPPNVIRDGEILNKEELKKILCSFLESANPQAITGKRVVCSFPSKKVFTHIFEFPADLTEKELKKAIPFEAETVIPFSIQDVYWDIRIIHTDEKVKKHATQKVLFACVPKATADSYVDLLNSMELVPFAFTTPSECAEYGLQKQLLMAPTALVIDVGSLVTTFSLFENGDLRDTFSSLDGGRSLITDLAKKYQMPEASILEQKERNCLDKVLWPEIENFIRKTLKDGVDFLGKRVISDVFITGEFLNLPNFYEDTKKFFTNQRISFGDPRIGIEIDSNKFLPLDKKDGFVPYSIYFTQAFGLALKGANPKATDGINLLPDRLRESFVSKKVSFLMGIAAVALTLLTLGSATLMTMKNQEFMYKRLSTEAEKNSLQQMIFGTRYQDIKKAIVQFNDEVSSLTKVQSSLFSIPTLLSDVSDLMPAGIKISSLTFTDSDLSVELSGIANNRNTLLAAQKKLEEASFVEELIAPRSNFDEKSDISFFLKVKLKFNELEKYGAIATK